LYRCEVGHKPGDQQKSGSVWQGANDAINQGTFEEMSGNHFYLENQPFENGKILKKVHAGDKLWPFNYFHTKSPVLLLIFVNCIIIWKNIL
jgi:hypothetical protein